MDIQRLIAAVSGRIAMLNMRRISRIIFFAVLTAGLFMLATCAVPLLTRPTATLPPTEAPMIMCTAPYCWEDEVFTCPGKCPGGCGTTCSTRTPDPAASPTPTIPSFDQVCDLPADTPTPGMTLCASSTSVRVGETVQVAAVINSQAHIDFVDFTGTDVNGTNSFSARIRLGGHPATAINGGARLAPLSIQTEDNRIFIVLKAESAGEIKLSFRVIPTSPDIQASLAIDVEP